MISLNVTSLSFPSTHEGTIPDYGPKMFKVPCCYLGWSQKTTVQQGSTLWLQHWGAMGDHLVGHRQELVLVCTVRVGCRGLHSHPSPQGSLPFLGLIDDVTDLHVEGPVLTLQGAICSFLCEETVSHKGMGSPGWSDSDSGVRRE